jgi:type IV secretory pathway VirB2 component (pilin)
MVHLNLCNWLKTLLSRAVFLTGLLLSNSVFAVSQDDAGLPFGDTMDTLRQAISGKFLFAAATIMIVILFLLMAFGDLSDGTKKIVTTALFLSGAFMAVDVINGLFGSGAIC